MVPTRTLNRPVVAAAERPRITRPRAPVRRRWWTEAVGVVVWATTLVVVALWVSNGGVQGLTDGFGSSMTSLGRLLGLISSNLLLLQVLAMARIPFAERALGQDKITRWHRLLGFTSVNLMLAHIVLITIGYASLAQTGVWAQLWSLVTTAPGMLLATAGTAMFLLIAVTSVRAARRRLKYESWHLLHLYAYLGAGLALPHQLWTGADFLSSPVATAYWWGLYGLALAAVLVFRVAVPLRLSLSQQLTVSQVTTEAPGIVSVYVTGPRLARLAVSAGQFFVWRFRTGPGWTRGHPLSMSAAPNSGSLRITLSVRGDDGERLATMKPGTRVLLEGPYGRLTPDVATRRGLVGIGSGLGVTPLIALLQDAVDSGRTTERPATLIRRASSLEAAPLQADVDRLVAAGVRVLDLIGPRSRAGTSWLPQHLGHVPGPKALLLLAPDLADCDVYLCGTGPWMDAVTADLHAAGVPDDALHIERFDW
ncbi:ferredoxin reductase family protein [Pengzhenrongella frigida]|uniref:Oxidoreductase n=1 Tax=Pengzhenrongella frigida TaxID=1259133 RepID=A0A4Q5N235_9MICO|nr:ferredoxin reductase family protein [Cellulomonas sp. HLT2-17]RYV50617.1 oxidoreductase [Cellulomonas sp. HLT2-17]